MATNSKLSAALKGNTNAAKAHANKLKDAAGGAAKKVGGFFSKVKETATEKGKELKTTGSFGVLGAKNKVKDVGQDVGNAAKSAFRDVKNKVKDKIADRKAGKAASGLVALGRNARDAVNKQGDTNQKASNKASRAQRDGNLKQGLSQARNIDKSKPVKSRSRN